MIEVKLIVTYLVNDLYLFQLGKLVKFEIQVKNVSNINCFELFQIYIYSLALVSQTEKITGITVKT